MIFYKKKKFYPSNTFNLKYFWNTMNILMHFLSDRVVCAGGSGWFHTFTILRMQQNSTTVVIPYIMYNSTHKTWRLWADCYSHTHTHTHVNACGTFPNKYVRLSLEQLWNECGNMENHTRTNIVSHNALHILSKRQSTQNTKYNITYTVEIITLHILYLRCVMMVVVVLGHILC